MTLAEAVRIAVDRTGHRRYAELLDPAHPDFNPAYEPIVRAIAEGVPLLPARPAESSPAPQPAPSPVASPPPSPSLLGMAASAAGAAMRFAAGGFRVLSEDATAERLAVCQACEHHVNGQCQVCHCFTKIKAPLPDEDCPLGKWPQGLRPRTPGIPPLGTVSSRVSGTTKLGPARGPAGGPLPAGGAPHRGGAGAEPLLQVSVGVPVPRHADSQSDVDALVNACPHRGCKTGCGVAECHAGKGDRQDGAEATIGHCRRCVQGVT